MPPLAHWDDVDVALRDAGHIRGHWQPLGRAAGSVGVGLNRIRLQPGRWSTPVHVHPRSEEIFYVLAGSGLSWQDGATYEVAAGDAIVHHGGGAAHSLRAGDDGLDVLAFGPRAGHDVGYLPRAGVVRMGTAWVVVDDIHPDERERRAGEPELPPPSERPATIVRTDDVAPTERRGATVSHALRDLGRAAGSRTTGLRIYDVDAGKLSSPPHCHSAAEELFVVLDGGGTLLLGDEVHPVRTGHVVSRPPGTGIAHAFRGGADGLRLLAYGTREPNDISFYPRSGKVFLRGVGVVGRLQPVDDVWEGED